MSIDLKPFFTPEALKEAFWSYKISKTDRYDPVLIKIPMGADGITWQSFEDNLDSYVRSISYKVLNGKYQFYPLREVEADKPGGGVRILAIASIRDALVQRQLYEALYHSAEEMFSTPSLDRVSFAYRKGKSTHDVARAIWQDFKRRDYGYAFDADIQKFFDTLNHDRLLRLVDDWVGVDTLPGTLLWRYVRTDSVPHESYRGTDWRQHFMQHKPQRVPRTRGVPQGGVLSGMLANLYLHEFDRWVVEDLGQDFDIRYYRYADDFVILARNEADAYALFDPVREKLDALRLAIHPDPPKTQVSNIAAGDLVFVGFHFTEQYVRVKPENIRRFKGRLLKSLHGERELRSKSDRWSDRLDLAIRWCVNPKILGPEPELCEKCGLPTERRRNWVGAFAPAATQVDQFRQLDRWIREQICKYFWEHYHVRLGASELREAGLESLGVEYWRQRQASRKFCTCDDTAPSSSPDKAIE